MDKNFIKRTNSAIKYTFIFNALSKASGVVAVVLLVRALSEYDYGVYNLLYSVIGLIGMIASFGIGNTLQRYIPEYYQKGEFIIAHNLYRTVSLLRLITNVIILGLALIFWQQIAPIIKLSGYKHYFMLFTLIIFLHMQRSILEICLSSYFLHKYSKGIGCVFPIIKAIGYSLIIFFDKSIWYAIITDLLAYIVVFVSLQIVYFKKIPITRGNLKSFNKDEKRRITRYALFYNFNDAGVGLLASNFDNFILVMFLNPIAVGAYSFCFNLTYLINSILPMTYFMEVIRPAFFSAATSSNNNNSTFFFQNIIKVDSLFSIPCCFFLLMYSHDIISIVFKRKFIEYSSVLTLIFLFQTMSSFAFPVELIAQLKEKADIILYSKFFAVYNIIADIVLIKYFGIWGAVFATGTATLGKNLFIWYFVREDAKFRGMGTFFLKIILFWIVISILAYYTKIFVVNELFELILGIVLFIIGFFVQFKCNYFNNDEKKIFVKLSNDNSRVMLCLKILKLLPNDI